MLDRIIGLFGAAFAEIGRVQLFDRSMAIAAQLFTSLVPILIAIGGLTGTNAEEALIDAFELPPEAKETALNVLAEPTAPIGVIGIVFALILATSLSRTLARMYSVVWALPRQHVRPAVALQWLAAVSALALAIVVARFFERLVDGWPLGTALLFGGSLLIQTALWMLMPYLLIGRQLSFADLLPGAVLAALVWWAISIVSGLYLPQTVTSSAERFGSLGIALVYLSWLYLLSVTVTATAVIGRRIRLRNAPDGASAQLTSVQSQTP